MSRRLISDIRPFCILAITCFALTCSTVFAAGQNSSDSKPRLEHIRINDDGKRFVLSDSGKEFKAWGVNYDHDTRDRLLEYYWKEEWPTVEADFAEMKALGANVVRIHLQLSRFMTSAQDANAESLRLLSRLIQLAETTGLYLDLTGLACYDKPDVPKWYNDLDEAGRWDVQARFWTAVARVSKHSPAVFCYDLMNEPVLTEDKEKRDWTPGAFGKFYFVQRLTLDFAGRTREQIAKAWVDKMVAAIREEDKRHLVTVGAIPWALTWPNAKPLFYSKEVSQNLDFVSVHFYPKSGEVKKALTALAVYSIGKPLVIEEMFPLSCSIEELDQFIEGSKELASGWISFYWGRTIPEYKAMKRNIGEDITMKWIEHFEKKAPAMAAPVPVQANQK